MTSIPATVGAAPGIMHTHNWRADVRSAVCDVDGLQDGLHKKSHRYKLALIAAAASGGYGEQTNSYHDLRRDEVRASGYVRGGVELYSAWGLWENSILFADVAWPDSHISAAGALIYNDSLPDKKALAVISFVEDGKEPVTSRGETFLVQQLEVRLGVPIGAPSKGADMRQGERVTAAESVDASVVADAALDESVAAADLVVATVVAENALSEVAGASETVDTSEGS